MLGLLILLSFTSHGAPIGAHAWSYKQQIFLALVGCLPICQVIYQERVRGLHHGFQKHRETDEKVECFNFIVSHSKHRETDEKAECFNFIVSRCLGPLMKPKTQFFEMTSQTKQSKNMQ